MFKNVFFFKFLQIFYMKWYVVTLYAQFLYVIFVIHKQYQFPDTQLPGLFSNNIYRNIVQQDFEPVSVFPLEVRYCLW